MALSDVCKWSSSSTLQKIGDVDSSISVAAMAEEIYQQAAFMIEFQYFRSRSPSSYWMLWVFETKVCNKFNAKGSNLKNLSIAKLLEKLT